MANNIVVAMQHIYFSYDSVPVLQDVSITINQKDFLAIIGPNGGGKTTILRLILGLLEPRKGKIKVFGSAPKKVQKLIGYLPQHVFFDFDFPMSVMETVLMARLGKRGIGKRYTKSDITISKDALKKIGMEQHKDQEIGKLSGGQRQRVLIARALATQPKLLLLDEPVSSVDTKWQQNFYELLHELNKSMAIVLVTHDISVISTYIDKIACVNKKLFYHGSKKEGIQKIAELYECPVQLIAHEAPHISLGEDEK
jgi:zinc transport system ATP-binding protein